MSNAIQIICSLCGHCRDILYPLITISQGNLKRQPDGDRVVLPVCD